MVPFLVVFIAGGGLFSKLFASDSGSGVQSTKFNPVRILFVAHAEDHVSSSETAQKMVAETIHFLEKELSELAQSGHKESPIIFYFENADVALPIDYREMAPYYERLAPKLGLSAADIPAAIFSLSRRAPDQAELREKILADMRQLYGLALGRGEALTAYIKSKVISQSDLEYEDSYVHQLLKWVIQKRREGWNIEVDYERPPFDSWYYLLASGYYNVLAGLSSIGGHLEPAMVCSHIAIFFQKKHMDARDQAFAKQIDDVLRSKPGCVLLTFRGAYHKRLHSYLADRGIKSTSFMPPFATGWRDHAPITDYFDIADLSEARLHQAPFLFSEKERDLLLKVEIARTIEVYAMQAGFNRLDLQREFLNKAHLLSKQVLLDWERGIGSKPMLLQEKGRLTLQWLKSLKIENRAPDL
jgi:hypothetical protein